MGCSLPTLALEEKGWIRRPEVLGLNYGIIALPFLSCAIRRKYIASLNPISSLVQWRYHHLQPGCRGEKNQEHITSSWKQEWSLGMLADLEFFPPRPFQAEKTRTLLAPSIPSPASFLCPPALGKLCYPESAPLIAQDMHHEGPRISVCLTSHPGTLWSCPERGARTLGQWRNSQCSHQTSRT